jgi:hypothetical protein
MSIVESIQSELTAKKAELDDLQAKLKVATKKATAAAWELQDLRATRRERVAKSILGFSDDGDRQQLRERIKQLEYDIADFNLAKSWAHDEVELVKKEIEKLKDRYERTSELLKRYEANKASYKRLYERHSDEKYDQAVLRREKAALEQQARLLGISDELNEFLKEVEV